AQRLELVLEVDAEHTCADIDDTFVRTQREPAQGLEIDDESLLIGRDASAHTAASAERNDGRGGVAGVRHDSLEVSLGARPNDGTRPRAGRIVGPQSD